jgi:hypothetical protein
MEIVPIVLAFPFLSSSWSFILACFGTIVGHLRAHDGCIGVNQQTVNEVSV